jgi:hypothetical protein
LSNIAKCRNNEISVYSINHFLDNHKNISNETPYFIFADKLRKNFNEKTILHSSGLKQNLELLRRKKSYLKKK